MRVPGSKRGAVRHNKQLISKKTNVVVLHKIDEMLCDILCGYASSDVDWRGSRIFRWYEEFGRYDSLVPEDVV